MTAPMWLLALLGVLGAFDTLWFHEWRGRLVARPEVRAELRLHVARDVVYTIVFATLPVVAWRGWWLAVLVGLLAAEAVITFVDFVTEDRVRAAGGGVPGGERVTHAVMGIVYGAMLATLTPVLLEWAAAPTGLVLIPADVPAWLRTGLQLGAVGTLLHGVRDLAAVLALPGSSWPWPPRAVSGVRP